MTEIERVSTSEARALTDRIKVGVEAVWELIERAYQTGAWTALGYASWDEYCVREFGTSRLRLPMEERREVVASLRDSGMSVRAIASATGHDKNTITKDLRQVSESRTPEPEVLDAEIVETPAPAKVVGLDGKTYAPSPRKTNRPPLPNQFRRISHEIYLSASKLPKYRSDERYPRNKAAISDACARDLRLALQEIQDLLDDLGED